MVNRPSTAGVRRPKNLPKERVIEVTEENMYALVNEIYDLKRKSYFNQRLLKVPTDPRHQTAFRSSKDFATSTKMGTQTTIQSKC